MELKPGYKQTEVGVIPEDWEVKPLLEVVGLPVGQVDPRVEPYRSMLLIAPDHIERGSGALLVQKTAAEQNAISGKYLFEPGDVVYSKIRPYLRKAVLVEFAGLCSADMYPLRAEKGVDPAFVRSVLLGEHFSQFAEAVSARSGIPKINRTELAECRIPLPPLPEQRAIAAALSDVDALLAAVDRLIAKKRAIKTAAMQQLLTGRQRLPGFSGAWETRRLGEGGVFRGGNGFPLQYQGSRHGRYPFLKVSDMNLPGNEIFITSSTHRISERSRSMLGATVFPKSTVIFAKIGAAIFLERRRVLTQASCIDNNMMGFTADAEFLSPAFAYYLLSSIELGKHVATTALPSLSGRELASLDVTIPTLPEQHAIAAVLFDMDAEIAALEARGDKTRQIKQGMMQELLTGRTRLVPTSAPAEAVEAQAAATAKHSPESDDAVMLSVLSDRFGSAEFPLGRFRHTKLIYLLHRHVEGGAEGYLKKAAGPYNPRVRYGGPERIARQSGYVRETQAGKYSGLEQGEHIDKATGYFTRWYGDEPLQWLEQFRYESNDTLEVLTTVDMAVRELRAGGGEVSVAEVRRVLTESDEWRPKLQRPEFSDVGIGAAIRRSAGLFGTE